MALPRNVGAGRTAGSRSSGVGVAAVLTFLAFAGLLQAGGPGPPPDEVWNNLLNQHYAYAQVIEQAVPRTVRLIAI